MESTDKTITPVEHTFPLVEVSGDSYQMGYQHGKQAGELIRRYLIWIERLTGLPREELCVNAETFLPVIESFSRPYAEEVRGLAHGADISFAEALLCQVRAEASHRIEGACTGFALTGEATADGNPLAGQNNDAAPEYADVIIMLRVSPTDGRPRALMCTFAGQLGYYGMNEFGVVQFANSLYNFEWRPGLPHYPLKRVMLEKRTIGQCLDLLRENTMCSALNMVFCDGQGTIADVEIRPGEIAIFEDDHPDRRIHANHYATDQFASLEDWTLPDSGAREKRLRALVEQSWGSITVETMKEFLADHERDPAGICRHGAAGIYSMCGYIAEPAKGLFHVRRGHGCTGTWHAYEV